MSSVGNQDIIMRNNLMEQAIHRQGLTIDGIVLSWPTQPKERIMEHMWELWMSRKPTSTLTWWPNPGRKEQCNWTRSCSATSNHRCIYWADDGDSSQTPSAHWQSPISEDACKCEHCSVHNPHNPYHWIQWVHIQHYHSNTRTTWV